jgi:cystathionine beta-lyase
VGLEDPEDLIADLKQGLAAMVACQDAQQQDTQKEVARSV